MSSVRVQLFCPVVYKNDLYILGGGDTNQISKLTGNVLQRIGTLPFEHHAGTCGSVADSRLYLCFNQKNENDYNRCRYTTDILDSYEFTADSDFIHNWSKIAVHNSKNDFCCKILVLI